MLVQPATTVRSARPLQEILVVLHQAHSATGRVGQRLREAGCRLDIRYPSLGDDLPHTLAKHAGVVVFGGPMSANDHDFWIRREINWLATPLRENTPFLGLCLGAQLMARQLGARVYTSKSKLGELGYHPLMTTPATDAVCAVPFPRQVYQWHFEGFDLPTGAQCLAEGGDEFPNQAYFFGQNVVGLQFHPEVTYQMICRWTTRSAACLPASARAQHLEGWFRYDLAVDRWITAFLSAWTRGALRPPNDDAKRQNYAIAAE